MIKKEGEKWLLDLRINGKRHRKKFTTKAEAQRYEIFIKNKILSQEDWNPSTADSRRLSDLIDSWYTLHGINLTLAEKNKRKLIKLSEELNNPIASKIDENLITRYRQKRLKDGIKPKTINNAIGLLNSLFNVLYKQKIIKYKKPFDIAPLKYQQIELRYLTKEEIKQIINASDGKLKLLIKLGLATGGRWGELTSLTSGDVKNQLVQFKNTKSKKIRFVQISKELETEVKDFLINNSLLLDEKNFKRLLDKLDIQLPAGQNTHILRHSFASWYVINGGNVFHLQKILGHSTINMTMRYAHLNNEYLKTSVALNPLNFLD